MEPSSDTIPQTTGEPDYERLNPQPQTEKTLAENYVHDARENAYANKGHGISDWIKNSYNYDQQQAGTMWVAGKINDVATQMGFLEATLNEDMYSELDLQKYFFDTNLATARAYAKEKRHETAYGYYRAAQEKALAEGQLTGWYMPAEANYMLSQWAVANENLKDPSLNTMDQARAQSVKSAVEGWFNANNITWRGIECLNHMYYKETVRHNREQERLQAQANEIAALQNQAQREQNAANAAASGRGYELQLRQWEFQMAELERDFGYDITGEGIIGHTGENAQRFGYYNTTKEWAQDNLEVAFNTWGSEVMKGILGDDFQKGLNSYKMSIQNNQWFQEQAKLGTGYVHGNNLQSWGSNKIKAKDLEKIPGVTKDNINTIKDATLKIVYTSPDTASLYVVNKDGVAFRVTDGSLTLLNGKTLNDMLASQSLKLDTTSPDKITSRDADGNNVTLNIGKTTYGKFATLITKDNYKSMLQNPDNWSKKGVESYEKLINEKGMKYERGLIDGRGNGKTLIFSDVDKDNNKVYYAFNTQDGKYDTIKPEQIRQVDIDPNTGKETVRNFSTGEIIQDNPWNPFDVPTGFSKQEAHGFQELKIGKDKKDNGSVVFYKEDFWGNIHPITTEEAQKYTNLDLYKMIGSAEAYANNIPEAEYFETKSIDDIIKEVNGICTEDQKEQLKKQMESSVGSSGSSGGGSSSGGSSQPRNVEGPSTSKSDNDRVQYKRTETNDVLEDQRVAYASAELGKLALDYVEKNKEILAAQYGLSENQMNKIIKGRKG